jgi:ketopantoate hydroxymethyltransferase
VALFDRFTPKFAKSYLNLNELLLKALATFREEVLMQTKTYNHPDSYGSFLSGKRGTHEELRTFP